MNKEFWEVLQIKVQVVGIVITLIWAAYTFIYKEITIPSSTPVNITVNLQLQKIGNNNFEAKDKKSFINVEMKISATNPSNRTVYLLTNYWAVAGVKIALIDDNSFNVHATEALKFGANNYNYYVEKYAEQNHVSIIAIGKLFPDSALNPNETLIRTVIIHIPENEYDQLQAVSAIPSISKDMKLELDWKVTDSIIDPFLYRTNTKGERILMKRNEFGAYSDKEVELQVSRASGALSLWH